MDPTRVSDATARKVPSDGFGRAAALVRRACRRTGPTFLRPEAFFVARSGVLTLAYSGFTSPLLRLKSELEAGLAGMPPEQPGSQWPKSTLAALRDERPLTADEIVLLKEATLDAGTCLARSAVPIPVESVILVELHDRAMERTGRRRSFRLLGRPDPGSIDPRSRAAVNSVLAQWRREGLARYVPDLYRTGFREDHYRSQHRELSLVVPMCGRLPCVAEFRDAVDTRMPGRYAWFECGSHHVTVRTLGDVDTS